MSTCINSCRTPQQGRLSRECYRLWVTTLFVVVNPRRHGHLDVVYLSSLSNIIGNVHKHCSGAGISLHNSVRVRVVQGEEDVMEGGSRFVSKR